ncbi:type II toxin-antitoxin system PrlF family antitoxin [Plectonema cf. radiosum LEGE 06105]|uniref:Type II toxin-antitoxin system PrlF family antitoxin n=1 Tax=Plectonema cf. radiosum LEGE 06105 TaxID=945769 RepID=A0A8J7F5S3_9CYAN|nr:type II toxin-antitoxin system PrlF family antitoxin [Plectonema radiosum]MBE9214998.1 type II toxin-antitoxin system PrlF family antitoxin [Plectonema cf. radiosum LEGE 06105]
MTEGFNFQAESTLTDRYQTTVPENVRKALRLNKRDKIHYTIEPDGKVTMSRAELEDEDPIVGKFLNFLAQDMSKNPQNIKPISPELLNRTQSLIDGIEVDLDAPLFEEDE